MLKEYDLEECLVEDAPFAMKQPQIETHSRAAGPELKVFGERAIAVNRENRVVRLASGEDIGFKKLVLCTGAVPRKIPELTSPELVLCLR